MGCPSSEYAGCDKASYSIRNTDCADKLCPHEPICRENSWEFYKDKWVKSATVKITCGELCKIIIKL